MSFTDQKPRIATQEDIDAPWSGVRGNFACYMCGYRFKIGDYWRWVFTNNIIGAWGNPTVCEACDGEDVIERWTAMWIEWQEIVKRFWWFADKKPNRRESCINR